MSESASSVCETEKLLGVISDLGKQMLMCGAEINRVEDTITRLCESYNLRKAEVFSITSLVLVSAEDEKGRTFSQSRRVTSYVINLYRLEELNALSRTACALRPSAERLAASLDKIVQNSHFSKRLRVLGFVLSVGGFSVFFGGSLWDALFASLIALAIFAVERFCTHLAINSLLYNFIASFLSGALAVLCVRLFGHGSIDKIIIGDIMLFIPGLVLTNAFRDMVNGDTMAGFLRMCEAIITAVAIALGYFVALVVTGVSA
ncbi:MAG: threonine/serine exporter family protein [Clostridia bacterium]|nr:threonine/serine exporter family protein [Clostridia bacterium]